MNRLTSPLFTTRRCIMPPDRNGRYRQANAPMRRTVFCTGCNSSVYPTAGRRWKPVSQLCLACDTKRMYVRLTIRIPPRRLCTLCRQVGKRRRVASEFGVRSWWPGRSEVPFRPSSTASIFCRLAAVYHSTYSALLL
jgi:hypothetical protein